MSSRKMVDSSMTATTYSNEVRLYIISIITIYVMNICFSNFVANFTFIRSFCGHFLKQTISVFKKWRVFINTKRAIAIPRAKSTPIIFLFRWCNLKLFFTCLANMYYGSFLTLMKAFQRTISPIRMFKSRFKEFKFNSTSFTICFNSWNNKGFISTIFRTETFRLAFNSIFLLVKIFTANSTIQTNSFVSERDLKGNEMLDLNEKNLHEAQIEF